MTEPEETEFRAISENFFEKDWQTRFDVYYQVPIQGKKKYIKFGEYNPNDYSRLVDILQEKNNEVFYIKETDLFKYYQHNILKNLMLNLVRDRPHAKETFSRVYPVACRILQDYMEFPTSDEFLKLLDDIPDILIKTIEKRNLPLHQIYSVASRDNTVHNHCVNVGFYCLCLGREMEMSREELKEICLGGLLADIGMKYIPREVRLKQEKLSATDLQAIRRHPSVGKKALNDTKHYSDTVLRMAGEHHESFDGTGYPLSYSRDRINRGGRICKIADVFNALTRRRSYGKMMSPQEALNLMKNKMGSQFDPDLLATFITYAGKR